jgi:hypothetical protein
MGNYGPERYSYNPTTGNLASKAGVGHRRCPLQLFLLPKYSGETRVGGAGGGLAVVEFSAVG